MQKINDMYMSMHVHVLTIAECMHMYKIKYMYLLVELN